MATTAATCSSARVLSLLMLLGSTFIVTSVTGCGGKSRLAVAPVRGRVTYKGQGVPRATVIFLPVGETAETVKRLRPFAYTDDQGAFNLKTYVNGDGAPFGKYRVGIVAPTAGPTKRSKDDPAGATASTAPAVSIPSNVTNKFGNPDTSGIEVTVVEGENNLPPFAL